MSVKDLVFDEEDIFRFRSKAMEDEEKKNTKLKDMFELEEMALKQKVKLMEYF
jgi:hypothetical protein